MKGSKKKAWDNFSIYVRRRDCLQTTGTWDEGICITCGKRLPFKKLQAGHFVPGRHNAQLFSEKGVHAQCWKCNAPASMGGMNGNPLVYRRKIIQMYGEGYDEVLEAERNETVQYKENDYKEIAEKYKQKTAELIS